MGNKVCSKSNIHQRLQLLQWHRMGLLILGPLGRGSAIGWGLGHGSGLGPDRGLGLGHRLGLGRGLGAGEATTVTGLDRPVQLLALSSGKRGLVRRGGCAVNQAWRRGAGTKFQRFIGLKGVF